MLSPYSVVDKVKVAAVVCNQWGDTGKGKFVDLFSHWADIIARGTGGNNAGHTIVLNGKKYIFHLIPSGILKDSEGKINVMGSGMVVNLKTVIEELDALEKNGCSYNGLRISQRANLILPYHQMLDGAQSGMQKGSIGTTGRGIGPAYADKVARFGVLLGDLNDRDGFIKKLKRAADYHSPLEIDLDQIVERQLNFYQRIKYFVCDTDSLVRRAVSDEKRVLLEGAQGLLLSIEYGTHPYVTSSDTSRIGLAQGVGLLPEDIDLTLGIVKFPFMTRVGNGPFPTEYGEKQSEEYCAEDNGNAHQRPVEERDYSHLGLLINDSDEFRKGIGIRLKANEYGATTQRPRRVGRTDLVALSYALNINGPNVILTKPDCVTGMETVELGVGYEDESGGVITKIQHGSEIQYGLKGVYNRFDGWTEYLASCRTRSDLPGNFLNIVDYLERETGANVKLISVGPEAEQTVAG